ncbi:hypothetical protein [Rhizobium sp. BK251]|uniref:hypothetical protein n=1 Tax=Rhizobium sp. BK251 TaxID=2512125 RepID=UPI0010505FD7|nr:hypothetical protein [Rhizobium sp. BK251]TCL73534.1 hypothetical protein EV286_10363 [Rhizobium sp. BK251]
MKKTALLLFCLLASPGLGLAQDATAPVKEVMDATVKNWAGTNSDWIDIFDLQKLVRLYSRDFAAKYQAAAEHPAVDDDGISPFDYDVIINGEDACPLEAVSIEEQPAADGVTEVVVRFKKATCFEGDDQSQDFTTVRFKVIAEGDSLVIDDILTEAEPGQPPVSLKAAMVVIASGE